jgi:hypothetical protein
LPRCGTTDVIRLVLTLGNEKEAHMRRVHPRRPTTSLVVACSALFLSLSGAGYAALSIPPRSITSKELARNSVTALQIAPQAVDRSKMVPGTTSYAAYLQPITSLKAIHVAWSSASPGHPKLAYNSPGNYTVRFSRANGLGCAVPVAAAFAASPNVTFRVVGLSCSAQTTAAEIATSNGQDAQVMLQVGFTS